MPPSCEDGHDWQEVSLIMWECPACGAVRMFTDPREQDMLEDYRGPRPARPGRDGDPGGM
jgi:hypothetical protein